MAAPMKVFRTGSSKVLSRSRVSLVIQEQNNRSCHIAVQETISSQAKSTKAKFMTKQSHIGRSVQLLQNRLLLDQISSATSLRSLGVVRLYSVLPLRAIYTSPVLYHEDSTTELRKCWKCGTETNQLKELFFCTCGVVQSPADSVSYFTLFGVKEEFDLDLKKLAEVYKNLQMKLHPDRFSQNSEMEQSLAEQQSSLLNKAYFTLLKPLPRALYLLGQHGLTIEEDNTDINQEFLMEVLELNERIGEASAEDIREIEAEISSKIEESVKEISDAFAKEDFERAKDIAVRLKYYVNVEAKVKTFYRDRM